MSIIAGQTVLLTGASRGIGAFIARALAKEKATVIGVARSQEGLDRVSAEVKALGGCWLGITYDISDIESLPSLVEQINQLVGPIDILINNAAIEKYRPFQDYSIADIQSVLSTNLLAAMELSRLLLPSMLDQGRGHIVNIASLAAKKGPAYNSIYSASKAGLLMWSDALRQELVGTGVGISVICPGYVSEQGMSTDSGVAIPKLSGSSTPTDVAIATIKAIKKNQPEAIINQDPISEGITKLLLALWQIFPLFGDKVNQWVGVTKLNKIRAGNQTPIAFQPSESRTMAIATPNARTSEEKNQ